MSARFAIISAPVESGAGLEEALAHGEALAAVSRAILAAGHTAVAVGGSGQALLLANGEPDLDFEKAQLDHTLSQLRLHAGDFPGSQVEHAADLTAAGSLSGVFMIGDINDALVRNALSGGAPVACFIRTMPALSGRYPQLASHALDTTNSLFDAAYRAQKFVANLT